MRLRHVPFALTAALAVSAISAPAFACESAGGGSGAAPQQAKAAAKPAADSKMPECCAKTAAGNPQACCLEHAKGKKQACCEAADKGDKKAACCEAAAAGKMEDCCSADKPHGMPMHGKPGMKMGGKHDMQMGRRGQMGRYHGWGRHFPQAARAKGHEVRYMPASATSANQYVVLASNKRMQLNDWVSMGGQMNYALQLNSAPGNGPWFVPYGGFLPSVGKSFGPLRADVGALLGLGTMLRTGTVATTNDVLQARVMWVVEPRVELGWQGERMGVGLVGTYNLNPNAPEFGGMSAGLKMTWKGHGGMGHGGMGHGGMGRGGK